MKDFAINFVSGMALALVFHGYYGWFFALGAFISLFGVSYVILAMSLYVDLIYFAKVAYHNGTVFAVTPIFIAIMFTARFIRRKFIR